MKYYRDVELSVITHNPYVDQSKRKPAKVTHTVIFEHEDEQAKAEAFLLRVYRWSKGVHYEEVFVKTIKEHGEKQGLDTTTDITSGVEYQEPNTSPQYASKIHQLNQDNTMAKQSTKATQEVAVFEETAKKILLPEIPDTMVIGGIEISEAKIKEAVKAVKEIQVDVPKPEDTVAVADEKKKVYEGLVEKKNQFVKTRTSADKFRKEISDPLNKWVKELKAKTDSFGNAAKEGQDHCESQIYIWENWEAEQERIRMEAVQKIVDARVADLQSVQGIVNRDSLHWTFPHLPSKIVEPTFIESADDSEWNGLMKELEDSFKAEQAKAEQEKQALVAAQQAVFNARVQILQLMQYEAVGDTFSKNGHVVTQEQIKSLTDAEWMPFLTSHNTPKENINPFANKEVEQPAAQANPNPFTSGSANNPNPFTGGEAAFSSGSPFGSPENATPAQEIEEEPSPITFDDVAVYLFGENKWEDKVVSDKSSVRIFDQRNRDKAEEGLSITYEARFDNGLGLFIYKNSK